MDILNIINTIFSYLFIAIPICGAICMLISSNKDEKTEYSVFINNEKDGKSD